jgi:hypothetical protein
MDSLQVMHNFLDNTRKPFKPIEHHWATNASIKVPTDTEHPTGVEGSCLRKQYYGWKGCQELNPVEHNDLFKWYMGHHIEEMYEEGLKLSKIKYDKEVIIKTKIEGLDYEFSSRMDFIVYPDKENKYGFKTNQPEGIELKSSFGQGIKKLKKVGALPSGAYLLQQLCYLTLNDRRITIFNNPYFGRDWYEYRQFKVFLNSNGTLWVEGITLPWTFSMVVERWKELEKYLRDNILPPRDGWDKEKYPCTYCQYQNKCWGNNPEIIKEVK